MDKILHDYREKIIEILTLIETEAESFNRGAAILADAVKRGELIHVIGPGGHSNMAVEEVFWRAGGLVPINAILDAGTNLINGAKRSNHVERCPGYGIAVMDSYCIGKHEGEVIVIVNAYGINAMTIDIALEAKKRGMKTIGITSDSFARIVPAGAPSRHPSGLNLYENVDVYINNHLPLGDSVMSIEGVSQKMGATSTYCNNFCITCLMMKTAEKLVEMGVSPPVWMSANMPGGDEANRKYEEQYFKRVKHLM
jgi:uncharacterized phosphosugar-binding protein